MTNLESPCSRRDNRLVAHENDLAVLKLVRDYGHVRRSEVASAMWPHSSPGVARKMAYRTVRRLLDCGYLQEKANSLGGRSLVLASRGVARLRVYGISAHDGHELSSVSGPHFYHRTLGTRYLIERSTRGDVSYGEYALHKGWGPIGRKELCQRFGKVPDGLVLAAADERGYAPTVRAADWIEVESSYKPEQELFRIFGVAWKVGSWLDSDESILLDRVVFVYDENQRHENQITASLQRYLRAHAANESVLSSIVFVRCRLALPLVWLSYEEFDYLELSRTRSAT